MQVKSSPLVCVFCGHLTPAPFSLRGEEMDKPIRDGDIDSLSADGAQGAAAVTFKLEQTEAQFQYAVQELATAYGWRWIHIQPGASSNGYWRTPVTGQLGKGFPDLLLVKGDRMVAAELKAKRGKLEPSQEFVLGILSGVGFIEVYVWKPEDWDLITEVLSRADNP